MFRLPSLAFQLCSIVLTLSLMLLPPVVVCDDILVTIALEKRTAVIQCQDQALPDWQDCVGIHPFLNHDCERCYDYCPNTAVCDGFIYEQEEYYGMYCPELERRNGTSTADTRRCDDSCFVGCEMEAYLHMNCLYSVWMHTNLDCLPPEPSPTESPTKDDPATSLQMSSSVIDSNSSSHPIALRLQELGITLSTPTAPIGNYSTLVKTGNYVHLSGHVPQKEDGTLWTGKVGADLTVEEGYQSAKACAIQLLSTLNAYLAGDWSRVVKLVKLVGFVQCTDTFHQQSAVINGASDTLVSILGPEIGLHARSAVGSNALSLNIATEVECIFELKD